MSDVIDLKTTFLSQLGPNDKEQKIIADVIRLSLNQIQPDELQKIPSTVFDTFLSLLLAREMSYSMLQESAIDKSRLQETTQKMLKSLVSFYRADKKHFSTENEKILLDLFKIDNNEINTELKKKKNSETYLRKHFKNHKTELPFEKRFETSYLLEELHEELERRESDINQIEKRHREFMRESIMILLLHTEFFDYFIDKKHQTTINFLTDFFKENPLDLYTFIENKNSYLARTNTKYTKEPRGFVHIFENGVFASAVREKIPPSLWTKQLMLSLGCNGLHKESHMTAMDDFIQKLEVLPAKQIKALSKPFFKMINKIFLGMEETKETFDLKNLKAFLTTSKNETLQRLSLQFFNRLPDKQFYQIINKIKENEIQSVCRMLMKSQLSRKRLLNLTQQNGKHLVWTAYEKGFLKPQELLILINDAVLQNNSDFLFAPKDLALTSDFPAYSTLCTYFKDSTQSLRFINSFQLNTKTKEGYLDLVRDFITSPKMILKIAGLNLVCHHWAKEGSDEKLLDFFFTGDIKNRQNLTLKISLQQASELLLKQDKDGKTPWHYLCIKRNRLLFGKNFKVLHPLFLQSCRTKDSDGKTPLDYISDDLKFKKVLVEKIPAVEKLMTEAGLSLTYTPKQKEVKEVVKTEPKTEILPQKIEEKKQVWEIQEMGHDKLRKDDEFNKLLRQEINLLPPPQCGSVNVANRRLQKKEVFDAPVFKIWYENKRWRVPFIKDDETKTLFIFPASDRNDTYTNQDYCRIVRNRVKWLKRHIDRIKS